MSNSNHTHQRPLQMFRIDLKDQEPWFVLARDAEHAAFQGLELANAKETDLINVSYQYDW